MRCPVKPGMTVVANAGITAVGAMPGMTRAARAGTVAGALRLWICFVNFVQTDR